MGTLKEYLELWDLFEKEIETHHKLVQKDSNGKIIKKGNLSSFAKYVQKYKDSSEGYDYNRVYSRLKKMKQRKNNLTSIKENTLLELKDFYKMLKNDYFSQDLLDDERPKHWFD